MKVAGGLINETEIRTGLFFFFFFFFKYKIEIQQIMTCLINTVENRSTLILFII